MPAAISSAPSPAPLYLPSSHNPPTPAVLNRLLFPTNRRFRQTVLDFLSQPLFHRRPHISVRDHRALTLARFRALVSAGFFKNTVAVSSAGNTEEAARRYDTLLETVSNVDHSLEVLIGVSYGLFGATVRKLGSPQQAAEYLPRLENLSVFGCFALTELGHGSNVRSIETTAVYNRATQTFILNTPNEQAQKYWIGGAADNATHSVVFAKLSIGDQHYGIHVFIVPLRNANKSVCEGITIADCGPKAGLNGVDNGRIWFDNVHVPRKNMLSAISNVSPSGEYSSKYRTANERFGVVLAALTGGRVGIAVMATSSALLGLTIAIKYSLRRTAFAPSENEPEVPLLYYSSHQRQLMVPLATAYVFAFCARNLREHWYDALKTNNVSKTFHTSSAAYKALFTWFMNDALQKAREACGGQGYKSENFIAPLKADRDVMLTFEGANTVMLQQVAKVLLAEIQSGTRNGGSFATDSVLSLFNDPVPVIEPSASVDDAFLFAAVCRRERAAVTRLAKRFSEAFKRRRHPFHAWNDVLGDAERAAVAHMHRRMLTLHYQHVKHAASAEKACGDALALCGRLWLASVIEADASFIADKCITTQQWQMVTSSIPDLCRQMTGICEQLVDGAGFPDSMLSPIAGDYIEHNARAKL